MRIFSRTALVRRSASRKNAWRLGLVGCWIAVAMGLTAKVYQGLKCSSRIDGISIDGKRSPDTTVGLPVEKATYDGWALAGDGLHPVLMLEQPRQERAGER